MELVRQLVTTSTGLRRLKLPIQQALRAAGYELNRRSPAGDEHKLGLLARSRITTLIDVGANQGQYALAFRDLGFEGDIISFEPLEEAYSQLARHADKDKRWDARRCALGSTSGRASMNVSANSVSSSLLEVRTTHIEAEPLSRTVAVEDVVISTLDKELESISPAARLWLKLDVQGYESQVLDGAAATLGKTQVVQCELSVESLYAGQPYYVDMLRRLEALGFRLRNVERGFVDPMTGDLLQFDVVAARLAE